MNPSKRIMQKVNGRIVDKQSQLLESTGVYHGKPAGKRLKVIDWIAEHTEGRFFYDSKKVYFEKESDAVMFKLSFKL